MGGLIFLSVSEVLRIHSDQIARYGGSSEILDMSLIESAVMQPQAGFGGDYFHGDLASMAAAYLFHLAKNHGFADGNKRTGAAAAIVFLKLNGVVLQPPVPGELERLTIEIVTGSSTKDHAAEFFRQRTLS